MDHKDILDAIDEEITRLEHVRKLLGASDGSRSRAALPRSGANGNHAPKKRFLSEEARNRIAEAQRRRWAKQHKETASAAKKV